VDVPGLGARLGPKGAVAGDLITPRSMGINPGSISIAQLQQSQPIDALVNINLAPRLCNHAHVPSDNGLYTANIVCQPETYLKSNDNQSKTGINQFGVVAERIPFDRGS
jgi:hypothetical protein